MRWLLSKINRHKKQRALKESLFYEIYFKGNYKGYLKLTNRD